MNKPIRLKLAEIGFRTPAGRKKEFGPESGEAFREKYLEEAVASGQHVVLDLDGSTGGTSSFYGEAVGELIRRGVISREDASRRIKVETSDKGLWYIPRMLELVIQNAERRR